VAASQTWSVIWARKEESGGTEKDRVVVLNRMSSDAELD
jgi:hypothetical protein